MSTNKLKVLENEEAQVKQPKKMSYSELKIWNECTYKHKLIYLDKIREFLGNEYTAFGTALHHVCENIVIDNSKVKEAKLRF